MEAGLTEWAVTLGHEKWVWAQGVLCAFPGGEKWEKKGHIYFEWNPSQFDQEQQFSDQNHLKQHQYYLDVKEYSTSGETCRLTKVGIFHSERGSRLVALGCSTGRFTGIRAGTCTSWFPPGVGKVTGKPALKIQRQTIKMKRHIADS